MNCKFCNVQIPDDSEVCPFCGEDLTQEPEQAVDTPAQEQVASDQTWSSEDFYEETPPVASSKKKNWTFALAIVGAVAALLALAVVLLMWLGVEFKLPTNDIFCKDTYAVEQEQAVEKADVVVAKIGDAELTNVQLQIYYRTQVMDFVNYYGSYLQTVGLDYTQPLSSQTCYFDETMTWEQYFIDIAIQTWQSYQTIALQAQADGFALDEEWETELAAIPESLEEQATAGEYDSVEAMLQDVLGPGCTMDDYMAYIRLNALAQEYYATRSQELQPTDEDAEAYFLENEASFAEAGVTQESGLVSSVRHILVTPETEEAAEDSEATDTTITQEQWDACLAQAQTILDEWKNGDATEESFAALATAHTDDPGSATNGGLYENITPTSSYVENFLNWSVDMTRQPGDTEIVKTEYGYHIMYFVSGEPWWLNQARTQLQADRTTEMLEQAKEDFHMKVNYRKIALVEPALA